MPDAGRACCKVLFWTAAMLQRHQQVSKQRVLSVDNPHGEYGVLEDNETVYNDMNSGMKKNFGKKVIVLCNQRQNTQYRNLGQLSVDIKIVAELRDCLLYTSRCV